MWKAFRLTIALVSCGALLAAVIVSAVPVLSLGEPAAAPRLVRESGPIAGRLAEEEPRAVCLCFTPIPGPPERKPALERAGGISGDLYEPPSKEIEKPFSKAREAESENEADGTR